MRAFVDCKSRRHEILKTADGVNISVREWGNPDGRPILFIHGVVQCHLAFVHQFASEELSAFRIVAYDVRGHGESDKPTDLAYYQDHRRWADEVQSVIDGMRLDRPIVAGWSMGGRIIGQYLTVYGDGAIAGIHLVGARVVADPRFTGPAALALASPRESGLAPDILSAASFVRACFHRPPSDDAFAFALAYNMVAWRGVQGAMRSLPPRIDQTVAALRKVRVPTLITHGALDTVVLPSAAEFAAGLIEGSQLSIYPDCGHSPFWEHPQRFNRESAAFARHVFGQSRQS